MKKVALIRLRGLSQMATIKILKPIKVNLAGAINYIMDKEKTLDHTLVSAFGCNETTAEKDFNHILTDNRATNRSVKAQHIVQSFKPGEIDLSLAHEIGRYLADKYTEGRHQYVLSTHADQKHIHNHIIFNNVSYIDFKTFRSKKENIYRLREFSDDLCRERGLSIIEKSNDRKKRIDPKYYRGKYRNTFRNQLKNDMDITIRKALNYQDFITKMQELDWDINESKERKYTTFKHKSNGQKRPIRMERLGAAYSKNMIEFRIDNEFVDLRKHDFKPIKKEWVDNIIDLTSDEKFMTQPGLRYWAIRHNNQTILNTLSRMSQLGCGSYNQMQNFIRQLQDIYESDNQELKEINLEINNTKDIIFKAKELKKMNLLLEHADLLEGKDKEDFIKDNNIDSSIQDQIKTFKEELLLSGILIESVQDIDKLVNKSNKFLENKRKQTKEILSDQQKEQAFIREMQYLSNNYDRFIGRKETYSLHRNDINRTES